jgi:hypothetical protein
MLRCNVIRRRGSESLPTSLLATVPAQLMAVILIVIKFGQRQGVFIKARWAALARPVELLLARAEVLLALELEPEPARLTSAVLNVERDVSKFYVRFVGVVASAGVLVFGVLGEDLRIPAIDRDQVLPADLQPFGMTAYHTVCLDHVGVALILTALSLAHTAKALTA